MLRPLQVENLKLEFRLQSDRRRREGATCIIAGATRHGMTLCNSRGGFEGTAEVPLSAWEQLTHLFPVLRRDTGRRGRSVGVVYGGTIPMIDYLGLEDRGGRRD